MQLSQVPKEQFFFMSKFFYVAEFEDNWMTSLPPNLFFNPCRGMQGLICHRNLRDNNICYYDAYKQSKSGWSHKCPTDQVQTKKKIVPYQEICTSKNTHTVGRAQSRWSFNAIKNSTWKV